MRKIKFTQQSYHDKLQQIIQDFPKLEVSMRNVEKNEEMHGKKLMRRFYIISLKHAFLRISFCMSISNKQWSNGIVIDVFCEPDLEGLYSFEEKFCINIFYHPPPPFQDVHPFYADLMNVLYDKDHYKLALGQINTALHLIDK